MGELTHVPERLTKDQLLALIDEIRAGVESGDTGEGFFEFLWYIPDEVMDPDFKWDDENPPEALWDVRARYRIGNTMGQGGMRFVGELR